jgi:hypothetical protein
MVAWQVKLTSKRCIFQKSQQEQTAGPELRHTQDGAKCMFHAVIFDDRKKTTPMDRPAMLDALKALGFDPNAITDSTPDDGVAGILQGVHDLVQRMSVDPVGMDAIPNKGNQPDANAEITKVARHFERFSEAYRKVGISKDQFVGTFAEARKIYGNDYSAAEHCGQTVGSSGDSTALRGTVLNPDIDRALAKVAYRKFSEKLSRAGVNEEHFVGTYLEARRIYGDEYQLRDHLPCLN